MTQENKSPKEGQDFANNSGNTNVKNSSLFKGAKQKQFSQKKRCEMNQTSELRRKLSEIPKLRALRLGEQINDACLNLAHDPCLDSWKTVLFQFESGWKEVRNFCPEIPVETAPDTDFDS